QQGLAMANTAQAFGRNRLTQIASARPALGPASGAGAGAALAGGPAGLTTVAASTTIRSAGRGATTAVMQPPAASPTPAPRARPTGGTDPDRPGPASGQRP